MIMLGDDTAWWSAFNQTINWGLWKTHFKYRRDEVPHEETYKYGIIVILESQVEEGLYNVRRFVEPKPEDAPSNLKIIGRYFINAWKSLKSCENKNQVVAKFN